MFNLFKRKKSDGSSVVADHIQPVGADNNHLIHLDAKARIQSMGSAIEKYLLTYDYDDVLSVLPENLMQLCQSISKSGQSRIVRRELADSSWAWKVSVRNGSRIIAQLLNYEDHDKHANLTTTEQSAELQSEALDMVPASICMTTRDSFRIVYANERFQAMFANSGKDHVNDLALLINDRDVIAEIEALLDKNNKVEGMHFVHECVGESFWQNKNRSISINIQQQSDIADGLLIWAFEDVSQLKILATQQERYKRKFDTAIQAATEGIWEWSALDEHGDWWSNPMFELLGLDVENIKPSLEMLKRLMHPKDKKLFVRLIEKELAVKPSFKIDCRLSVHEKGFHWFRLRVAGVFSEDGELNKLIGSLVNIHAEKSSRIQLQQEKNKAVSTLNSIVDAVITTDADGIVEYQNSAAERLTGIPMEQTKGLKIDKVISFYKEHSLIAIDNPVIACLSYGKRMKQKIYADMMDTEGTRYTIQLMATPLIRRDGHVYGAVMVLNDVTNIRVLSRRLKYQASHDILTKLINRGEFEKRVLTAISLAHNEEGNAAVLFIDLDRFKLINDICGHAAGDELLKQVANLLRKIVKNKSSVARMGGDEFAVLLLDTSIYEAGKIANTILSQLAAYRFSWDEKTFSVECSIGAAEITPACDGLTYILNAVDSACYLAKESGRNCLRLYCDGDDTIIERKGQERWIQYFDNAIDDDALVLYAQPIISLDKQQAKRTSLEVLIRMLADDGTVIPPNAFLPAVERYDRAYKLDRWIIEKVFRFISENKKQVAKLTKISINLSGQSVAEDELLSFIQQKARQYGVDARKICFEITETAAIANLTTAIELIEQLKQDGFLFALDDFGSGLSSFAYLKSLPVDYLKIDGIFVKDMQTDKVNYAMVKAIHEMSAVLNKQTIAEYVENEAVAELLTEIGVDYGQGFHLGKPQPIETYFNSGSLLKRFANTAA